MRNKKKLYPSDIRRMAVIHICGNCGTLLRKKQVTQVKDEAGDIVDLYHFRNGAICGNVNFSPGPAWSDYENTSRILSRLFPKPS